MYQGVFEKNGVSPEVASQAADQLARGNGVAQSPEVRKAHDQALANIGKAQQVSAAPAQQPAIEKNGVNQSPETRQVPRPTPANTPQSTPSAQVAKPIPKAQKNQTSKVKQTQDMPVSNADRPVQAAVAQASDPLWQRHSPTEQGTKKPGIDYKNNPRTNDARFAYNALSTEANKDEIKQSIIRNSPEAKNNANPEQYADQSIAQAEQAIAATRSQQPAATSTQVQNAVLESGQENTNHGKTASQVAQSSAESKSPQQIWDTYKDGIHSIALESGEQIMHEQRDLILARDALSAGHSPKDIQTAISENSTAMKAQEQPQAYAQDVVDQAQADVAWEQAEQRALSEQGSTEEAKLTPEQPAPQPAQPTAESSQTQDVASSQETTQQNDSSQKAAPVQAQSIAEAAQPVAELKLTPQEIYSKFSETKETGVFAQMSRQNAKVNDLAVAQKALAAGHEPSDVQTAISEHSPHAQTLSGSKSYAKRTVGKAQEALGKDSKETQSDQGHKSESGQSREKTRQPKDRARSHQSGKKVTAQRPETRKKVKSKSRETGGVEM